MRRERNEAGTSMVEAAIGALLIFGLIFMVIQCAFLGRAHLAARYGAASGAQAGAVAGNDPAADYDVLQKVKRAASVGSSDSVQRIVVFKASGPGAAVPPACLTGGVPGVCNSYTGADMARPETSWSGAGGWTGDDSWPSANRQMSRSVGTDYIGVYVQTKVGGIGPIGGPVPQTLSDTSVARIEAAFN